MKYSYIIISAHVPVLATVLSAVLLYRTLSKALKVLAWFIFFSGIIQFTSLYFWYHYLNNFPLLHIYVAGGFVCLAWFYRTVLDHFIRPLVIWIIAMLFILFCIINVLFIQPVYRFNSYALIVESVLVIILSLFTFLFLLNHTIREAGIPDIKSIAWINSGLFIYFLSCFLIYYMGDVINNHFTLAARRFTWLFHSFFSIIMYSCFLIGLWKRSKTPT